MGNKEGAYIFVEGLLRSFRNDLQAALDADDALPGALKLFVKQTEEDLVDASKRLTKLRSRVHAPAEPEDPLDQYGRD